MKVSIDLQGPNGKMWELDMQYHRLPEAYAWEVGGAASSYASYIENLQGTASDKAYSVSFRFQAEGGGPKGQAKADRLSYSQAVGIQEAGLQLLQKLLIGANMEIASGQRQ